MIIPQRTMGRTGLTLSELCLGTLNFGLKTDEPSAHAILDAYHAAGGNFIQASAWSPDLVLPSASTSRSEEIVGNWWTRRNIPRENIVLATRIRVRRPGGAGSVVDAVRGAMRDSLGRLHTEYLDLVLFEWSDCISPADTMLEAFDIVVRSGFARFIGASNFPAWRVADTLARAHRGVHNRMEALQADYSLMTRARFEPETKDLCHEHRLGFFATSPLAGGFLTRARNVDFGSHTGRRDRLAQRFSDTHGELAHAAIADVAARHEASPAQVSLAWVLHEPGVTSALIGVQSFGQLSELVQAAAVPLSTADLHQLDQATAVEEVRVTPESPRPRLRHAELMLN